MLKALRNRIEAATTKSPPVAMLDTVNRVSSTFSNCCDNKAIIELAKAERQVCDISACVDRQRQLISKLEAEGADITSAQITLDSLIVSLFLAAEDRHRLRATMKIEADKSLYLRGFQTAD